MRQVLLDRETLVAERVARHSLDERAVLVAVHYSFLSPHTNAGLRVKREESFLQNVPGKVRELLTAVGPKRCTSQVAQLGRSCAGRVLAVGAKVTTFRPGDWVACSARSDTEFSDLVCVPEQFAVRVPRRSMLKDASLVSIGAVALESVRRARLRLAESVCVYGLGLLGQLTVQLAKRAGCFVIGVDILPERLKRAERAGADAVFHATEEDATREILLSTEHHGVDASLVTFTPDDEELLSNVIRGTRQRGRLVVVSESERLAGIKGLADKEISLTCSANGGPGAGDCFCEQASNDAPYAYMRWTEQRNMRAFIDFIERGQLETSSFCQEEFVPERIEQACARVDRNETFGVVIKCAKDSTPSNIVLRTAQLDDVGTKAPRFAPATRDQLRVGMVGIDGTTARQLLPMLQSISGVKVSAVVDGGLRMSRVVRDLIDGNVRSYPSEDGLIGDDAIDVVFVSSPRKFRVDRLLRLLRSGKAVFARGAVAATKSELQRLLLFLKKNSHAPFCVGYSLPFAPLVVRAKEVVVRRRAPMMVQCRINAGCRDGCTGAEYADDGRILSEASHVIDMFCFLTDAQPVAVSVEALHLSRKDIFPTDNFCAQISFDDGSICSLLHTTIGNGELGGDRVEIFFDGKSILLEDYASMHGFGLSRMFDETMPFADRGQEALLRQFFRALESGEQYLSPIDPARFKTVSELTLIIDQLACEGGGTKTVASI